MHRGEGYIGADPQAPGKVVALMAAKKRASKITESAWATQGERYIQRLLEDEELRGRLVGAYTSARSAYGRLSNGKGPTHALFEDPKLQKELLAAATALRDASSSLMDPAPKPRRRRRGRRTLALILVGGALAIVLSSDLRKKVLDLMFGAEETFDYSSTTTPPTPAPEPVAS
jgi:hypothetical protein